MVWFRSFGYTHDPFTIDPQKTPFLVGLEELQEELLYALSSGSMLVIEGERGLGKTSLLHYAIAAFGSRSNLRGKLVYLDAAQLPPSANIEQVLQDRLGWKGRILGKIPKHMLLLIDNAEKLSERNCERVKYFYDNDYLRSVIFALSHDRTLPQSIKHRVHAHHYQLVPLTHDYAVQLLAGRQNTNPLLERETVDALYRYSHGNPRLLLALASCVAEHYSKTGNSFVDDSLLEAFTRIKAAQA